MNDDTKNTIITVLAAGGAAVAGIVLAGGEEARAQLQQAADDVVEQAQSPGTFDPDPETWDLGDTPPEYHVAPEGSAEPSDGDPTTTDPRDPGGSQTTTPYEQDVQDAIDESDAWDDVNSTPDQDTYEDTSPEPDSSGAYNEHDDPTTENIELDGVDWTIDPEDV